MRGFVFSYPWSLPNFDLHYVRYSDSLRAGRSGNRIPVGVKFSALLPTYTMGTGSFPGVKWPRRGVDHSPPFRAEVKEIVELYLYSPFGPSWPFRHNHYLPPWIRSIDLFRHLRVAIVS